MKWMLLCSWILCSLYWGTRRDDGFWHSEKSETSWRSSTKERRRNASNRKKEETGRACKEPGSGTLAPHLHSAVLWRSQHDGSGGRHQGSDVWRDDEWSAHHPGRESEDGGLLQSLQKVADFVFCWYSYGQFIDSPCDSKKQYLNRAYFLRICIFYQPRREARDVWWPLLSAISGLSFDSPFLSNQIVFIIHQYTLFINIQSIKIGSRRYI